MAKFKSLQQGDDNRPQGTIVDGQLYLNDKEKNFKLFFIFSSPSLKQKNRETAQWRGENLPQFLRNFEPIDDAAKKMVADFSAGKASAFKHPDPPKIDLDNLGSTLDASVKRVQILSTIGFLAGLGFAFHKKSGVGGYIGYAILFSFSGSLIAIGSIKLLPPK